MTSQQEGLGSLLPKEGESSKIKPKLTKYARNLTDRQSPFSAEELDETTEEYRSQGLSGSGAYAMACLKAMLCCSPHMPDVPGRDRKHKGKAELQQDIKAAKEGYERFKEFYNKGDSKRKKFFLETDLGQELQAMYLGLKLIILVEEGDQGEELLTELPEKDWGIVERDVTKNNKVKKIVFNNNSVEKVITVNSDYFDYTAKSPISLYMQDLVKQWDIPDAFLTAQDKERRCVQIGLLCGFPRNAVEQFAKYADALRPLIGYLTTPVEQFFQFNKDLSAEDHVLFKNYFTAGREGRPNAKEVNTYRDEHEEEIRSSLNKTSLKEEPEKIEYLVSLRDKELRGHILYISGNPNNDDRAFEEKVDAIFEQSGMSAFLAEERRKKRLSILLGEFGCKIVASEGVCPGNSSCASLGFTPKDRVDVWTKSD
jgi:hypothetical protein